MTKMYRVTSIGGSYPPVQVGVINTTDGFENVTPWFFATREEAETFAAGLYEAQVTDPFYPLNWWTIDEVSLVDGFDYISGYAPPFPIVIPNPPSDIIASNDGTNFTVSWTPNPTTLPEYYQVNFYTPGYELSASEFGVSSDTTAETSMFAQTGGGTNGWTTFIQTSVGATTATLSSGNWVDSDSSAGLRGWSDDVPTGTDLSFSVQAINAYTLSAESTLSTSGVVYQGVPAIPTDTTLALDSTTSTTQTYTLAWTQPYPTGAGAPTSWQGFGPGGFSHGFSVSASGTPSTGSVNFTVHTSDPLASIDISFFAVNTTGSSACALTGFESYPT